MRIQGFMDSSNEVHLFQVRCGYVREILWWNTFLRHLCSAGLCSGVLQVRCRLHGKVRWKKRGKRRLGIVPVALVICKPPSWEAHKGILYRS